MSPGIRFASQVIGNPDDDVMTSIAAACATAALPMSSSNRSRIRSRSRPGFRSAGWITFLDPQTVNWRVETAGEDFDAYWAKAAGAASQHRQTQGEGRRARHFHP
jgi:hypothetical protein